MWWNREAMKEQKASRNANRDRGIRNIARTPSMANEDFALKVKQFTKKVRKREK